MKYDEGTKIQLFHLEPQPKMVESPANIAHAPPSYACAQDGYFKRSHTMSFDGDKRWDSGWILFGFGVGGRLTRD